MSKVLGCGSCWSLGRDIGLGQAAVDNKIGCVYKAALVAGQKDNGLGLLNGFAKAASREVHLAAESLGLVATEKVLEHGRAGQWRCVSNVANVVGNVLSRSSPRLSYIGICNSIRDDLLQGCRTQRVKTES
jgi:hypothetical protein